MTVLGPTLTHSPMATVLQIGTAGAKNTYYHSGLCNAFGSEQELEKTLEGIRQNTIEPYQVAVTPNRIGIITNWRAIPEFKDEGIDEKTGRANYLIRIQREQDLSDSQVDSEHELIFDSDKSAAVFEFTEVMKAQQGDWESPLDSGVYYAGVDGSGKPRAGRKGDFTVCCILRKDGGKYLVVSLYRRRGITFEKRYADICEKLKAYKPIETFVEANDGMGQTFHENISSGCPALDIERFNNNKERKMYLVNKIQLALERGDLTIPKSAVIDELLSFQLFDDGSMGAVGKDAHDDCVMALGLALAAARYGSWERSRP
jgi:phage terminase large subunit-like protein